MSPTPVETVLVANRGEIAVRVIDACHRLGLRAIAVYSDADRDAPHVARADEAVRLGPAPARDSYLAPDAVLRAAALSGADAVHPGYGFLSENGGFARACGEAGLVFVGPRPEVIEAMGAKTTAKAIAVDAGLPVVPGYHGDAQDDATLVKAAAEIGWPLLIKASAGGGGRGMRRVDNAEALKEALALARAEARGAFGDPTLLLERFVPRARHLEVQVLGDRHGNVVHLLERDCSLQRHHQKLVEEAPAASLPEARRRDLRCRAVALARVIGYDSAGTVEFVYDPDADEAWFLEMNTRLQVEHPVTEAVTGIDLVAWQLRIAAGEPLDIRQEDIRADGWAIEARVAAENPAEGYASQTGILAHWRVPSGPGLRVDAGVAAGRRISHHYDSLLAKVIAHGRDREQARRRLLRALGQLEAAGVGLNAAFLRDLLALPAFAAGRHHTGSINEAWPDGWRPPPPEPQREAEAVLAGHLARCGAESGGPWSALDAWRVTGRAGRTGAAVHHMRGPDGKLTRACVAGRLGDFEVSLGDEDPVRMRSVSLERERLIHEVDGRRRATPVVVDGDRVTLLEAGGALSVTVSPPESALLTAVDAAGCEGSISAPMPGSIAEVRVVPGQAVRAGDTLCVLEAMKLFQELAAPFDGTVAEVRCAVAENVAGGAVLAVVAPVESPEDESREDPS